VTRKTHREIIEGWHPYSREEVDKYVAGGFWHNLTVGDLLGRNVARFPDKLALADERTEVTWRRLQKNVDRLAIHLKRLGIAYGDFFVVQMANVVEFYYLFFALNRLGAVPVMSLPRHRTKEIDHLLRLHEARGICTMVGEKFDFTAMVDEMKDRHPYLKVRLAAGGAPPDGWLGVEDLMGREIEKEYPEDYLVQFKPDPNDICCEQLSGGTTGVPKGIPRTHNDYICMWEAYIGLVGFTDESVCLVGIPVAHNAVFNTMAGPAFIKGATIIMTRSPRPKEQFALIEKYRVTTIQLIPVQITYWKEAVEERRQFDLSSLRVVSAGGQKVQPELARWVLEDLGVDLCNHFGMSEGITIGNRWDSPKEPQMYTIGYPHIRDAALQVKLVDEHNKPVRPGEMGEMVVKGPSHFKGYFRNPEQNKISFDEQGFFHSGDLMSQRPDGRFVVEGRMGDVIKRAGENVYPEPVEALLLKHPGVVNAAVIGIPDERTGEKLCCFVQIKGGQGLTFEEVQRYMKENGLAVFQWPERLEIVAAWPLTAVNKIDKRSLRAYIAARLFEEGAIARELGDDYLRRDKLTIDDVLTGRIKIEFTGAPE
jgi:2,3-dihydroxybenzoate-AMP ligase